MMWRRDFLKACAASAMSAVVLTSALPKKLTMPQLKNLQTSKAKQVAIAWIEQHDGDVYRIGPGFTYEAAAAGLKPART